MLYTCVSLFHNRKSFTLGRGSRPPGSRHRRRQTGSGRGSARRDQSSSQLVAGRRTRLSFGPRHVPRAALTRPTSTTQHNYFFERGSRSNTLGIYSSCRCFTNIQIGWHRTRRLQIFSIFNSYRHVLYGNRIQRATTSMQTHRATYRLINLTFF